MSDVSRNANVEHCLNGNKKIAEVIYSPGKVVIFGSHCEIGGEGRE